MKFSSRISIIKSINPFSREDACDRMRRRVKGQRCLSLFCLLVLVFLTMTLYFCDLNPFCDPDLKFAYLRHSRDAQIYVRPSSKTVLVQPREKCLSNHRLLLMVTSAPNHTEQRQAIRQTWGKRHPHAKHFFFIGLGETETEPNADIRAESQQYGDVIVEDFVDVYLNLTLKTLFILKWVLDNCHFVPFVLKTDDDMLINTRGLIHHLDNWGDGSNTLISGAKYHQVAPYRGSSSKWYVPKWLYPNDVFPDFVSGTAYLMSKAAVKHLYVTALYTPLIPLEDVFLTGIVASQKLGLGLENVPRFRVDHPLKSEPCLFHHLLTAHELHPQELRRLWISLIDLKPSNCDTFFIRVLAALFGTGKFEVLTDDPW